MTISLIGLWSWGEHRPPTNPAFKKHLAGFHSESHPQTVAFPHRSVSLPDHYPLTCFFGVHHCRVATSRLEPRFIPVHTGFLNVRAEKQLLCLPIFVFTQDLLLYLNHSHSFLFHLGLSNKYSLKHHCNFCHSIVSWSGSHVVFAPRSSDPCGSSGFTQPREDGRIAPQGAARLLRSGRFYGTIEAKTGGAKTGYFSNFYQPFKPWSIYNCFTNHWIIGRCAKH